MSRPNILIFMTDQQQAQVVRPEHPCRTPNVQRLADDGLAFTRAYTPTAHCCPSRATFMTGLYPSRHGVFNNVLTDTAIHETLNPGIRTFDQSLSESGYRMLFSGKWHVSAKEDPGDRAWEELNTTAVRGARHEITFDHWKERAEQEEKAMPRGPRRRGELFRNGWGPYHLYGTAAPRPESDPYNPSDLRTVQEAVSALESLQEGSAPWCLYVGTVGPHDPYVLPEKYASMYDPKTVSLPRNYRDGLEDKPTVYQRQRRFWNQLSEEEVRESIAHYWGYCTMQDDLFGIVLDALDETGQADDTLVVYLSDHGDYVGAHGLYLKGVAAFDEAYHVPLAMRWPKGITNPGRVIDEFVTLSDFAPTFLDLAEAQPVERSSGMSLVPFLKDETPRRWRDAFYSQFNGVELYYTQRVVQTKQWKYVYNGFDFDELYDLTKDPHETTNLISHQNLAGVVRAMCARMWRFAADEQDIIHNAYPTVSLAPFGPMVGFQRSTE